ncbi:MAG: hypothetical protein RSE62_03495 [Citrobacter sp.]
MKTKSLVALLAVVAACLAALFFCPLTFAADVLPIQDHDLVITITAKGINMGAVKEATLIVINPDGSVSLVAEPAPTETK